MIHYSNNLTPAQKFQLMQQMQRNANIGAALPGNMNGKQIPVSAAPKVTPGVYYEFRVTNANAFNVDVLLFDAIDAYALKNGYTLPAGVTIECTTINGGGSAGYQSLINDIATGTVLNFEQLNLECAVQAQFGRPISLYTSLSRTNNVTLYDTINPSMGRNSMQQQLTLIEVPYKWKIDRRSSMLYTQEPNSIFFMRFYAREEVAHAL